METMTNQTNPQHDFQQWPLTNSHPPQDAFGEGTLVPPTGQSSSNGIAVLAHISGMFTWIVGPAVFYAIARPGSLVRKEAAKAFNYQLVAGLLFVAASIVFGVLNLGGAVALLWLGWFGLTIVGAAKAGSGQDWTNPVNKYTKFAPMPVDGR